MQTCDTARGRVRGERAEPNEREQRRRARTDAAKEVRPSIKRGLFVMSIREYMQGSENVMFVADLLKSSRPEAAAAAATPKGTSIYERVRCEQRRLENESFAVGTKKEELRALEEEVKRLTKRHQIHRKREAELACEELRKEVEEIESGARIDAFLKKAKPYVHEFQRQQFCRSPEATVADSASAQLGPSSEHTNAVLNEFLVNVEGAQPKFDVQANDLCPDCKEPMQLYQAFSVLVCPKCSQAHPFLDATASLLAYSDDYDYCSFSYKRINHFSEWLASIQAKENLDVPDEVLQSVMQRLHDERIEKLEEVTVHKVREILKKLKLRKYYEHVQLITCKITGREPPRMTPEMEEKIKVCFLAASSAFQRHCPPDRKNMVSYSFSLLKLCELLGYTNFVPYFMVLKGKEKLSRVEGLWKKICEDLDWTYIPSIP